MGKNKITFGHVDLSTEWKGRVMNAGIYGIHCIVTDRWYIGASSNMTRRVKDHLRDARDGINKDLLEKDSKKYGFSSIEYQAIEYVHDLAFLTDIEQYWIDKLDSCRSGYNKQASGNNRNWI